MTAQKLEFKVRSGGWISIDLERCVLCQSKACLEVCGIQGGPLVLDESRGVPGLRWSLSEIEQGGCVECLGCELDCTLRGKQAVSVVLPLRGFDEYLQTLTAPTVYKR
jgi:succinyl-CoA synthetase beta subunit